MRLRYFCYAVCLLITWQSGAPWAYGGDRPMWADPDLPAVEGLVVWFDAAAQPAAAAAQGAPSPLKTGDSLEYWYDSSGNGRHLRQLESAARPTIRIDGELAAVQFGGRGPHFSQQGLALQFEDLTIFVVAAPASNEGTFRGFLSMNAAGKADFMTGLNIDQGAFNSSRFDTLNVESAGAAGMHNLRTKADPFLEFRRLTVVSAIGPQGVALYVDGQEEGRRGRTESVLHMDQLNVGARFFSGTQPHSFFEGEIAEVLIFDRALSDDERSQVDQYLAAKYATLGPMPIPPGKQNLRAIPKVAEPPAVQMHVPGFTARELPLELTNVNNVLYREDGVLVALGYDGNIHLLTDSDGDGLEDQDKLFWKNQGELRAPIGMALTPPGYKLGRGVVVAAKSKCVMLLDADGDDVAEKEVIIADGWKELWHGVDALGVAFDPNDHSVYFGLGSQNFTDPYLVGEGDDAEYRLSSERGTILRVAPDFKSRKIVATGIRFPVAIRFNRHGDLFCTDQEGATWRPFNGNPFDELLHVQEGRHYGYPPRHPRHLPDVIDEPSVFDYRPQHQSTCGLNFNEPAVDGSQFGPPWWQSDAIVSGYSRAKLYRTRLHRTTAGYIAQNQLFATLDMLTVDACVGPGRSLVVATHSGPPDWGTGAAGMGKLYKITHSDPAAPIPSLVWAEGPQEIRIAFDKEVDPATLKELASRAAIEGGEHVAAGDRFETLRPPYALVEYQHNTPRFGVDIQGVQLTADRRTLILTTAPHTASVAYAVLLPGIRPEVGRDDPSLPQLPDVDLQYDLCGVQASWQGSEPDSAWKGWLPHLDLETSRTFTQASAMHDGLWRRLTGPGLLSLNATLDLREMLRPVVQPGSKIDHSWPEEKITLTLTSNCRFEAKLDGQPLSAQLRSDGAWSITHQVAPGGEGFHPIELQLQHDSSKDLPTLTVAYSTNEDPRPRALHLRRLMLPWAQRTGEAPTVVDNRHLAELQGGSWLRGRQEFYGAEAGCSKCHAIRGEGASIGPDLTNLPKRDYASVLRDVTQPSFAINPDHVTQIIATADGLVLAGTVRTDGDKLIVSDQEGKETVMSRDDVEDIQPSELSIMPEGIPKTLGPERMRDLLTFLLVEPPTMPVYGELSPPPPREPAEVEAVLAGSKEVESPSPVHVVLVAGPKDHGLGEHDYPAWQTVWKSLLEMGEKVAVTTANPWPSEDDLKTADVLVFYQQGSWTPERACDIDRFLRRGGGLVYIHYAVDGGADPVGFAERIGLAWQGLRSKFRHGPLDVQFVPGSDHPIARNLQHVHFHDESYWNLVGDPQRINLLATGVEDEKPQPLFWTFQPEMGGRVFVSIPGHFSWSFDDPIFRILLLRGIAWTADEPVDRFNDLVLPGARVKAPAAATGAADGPEPPSPHNP